MERELEHKIQTALDSAFQENFDKLRGNLVEQVRQDCVAALEPALREARKSIAEGLSSAARRIRSEMTATSIAAALVESAAQYCGRAALLIHKNDRLLGFQADGLDEDRRSRFQQLDIALTDAAAIAHAVDTKDSVVASGTGGDLSAPLVELFGLAAENRVHLFPIVLRDSVLAVLYADEVGSNGQPQTAAIELLASLAEAWIEAVGTRGKAPPGGTA